MTDWLMQNGTRLLEKIFEHVYMFAIALIVGILIAVPLGIFISRYRKTSQAIISVTSVLQTFPSLAVLAIMVPILGIGKIPAIVALSLYSLLPILRNTYLGIVNMSPGIVDVAKGQGLSSAQVLRGVILPLAAPVIMSGIRVSGVYLIAWTTLAAYIGAGGLGDFIYTGLQNYDINYILGGTIPVSLMAILFDLLFGKIEKKVTPKTHR
ncbi:MAG TPA: ABC transporter permease [Clostridiaceae bacterium]|nr:ABC transporter permease [Clostridiaceae bacterium]